MNVNDLLNRLLASPFILAGAALLLLGGRQFQVLGTLVTGIGVFQTFGGRIAEAATGPLPTFGGGTTEVLEEGSIDQIFLPGGVL